MHITCVYVENPCQLVRTFKVLAIRKSQRGADLTKERESIVEEFYFVIIFHDVFFTLLNYEIVFTSA
jgi:hypothetical protein